MKSLNSQKLRIKLTKKRQKKEEEEEEEYLVEEKEGEEGLEGVHGTKDNQVISNALVVSIAFLVVTIVAHIYI